MSEVNVKIVRAAIQAFNAGDWEEVLSHADPDWRGRCGGWGRDGIEVETHVTWTWTLTDGRVKRVESVLLLGRLAVIGGTTPIELDTEFGQLFEFRDRKIVRTHDYLSHREALEAAGLSD
jgi:ketosteroid isomerase-like protein